MTRANVALESLLAPASTYICWPAFSPQILGVALPVLAGVPWQQGELIEKWGSEIDLLESSLCCIFLWSLAEKQSSHQSPAASGRCWSRTWPGSRCRCQPWCRWRSIRDFCKELFTFGQNLWKYHQPYVCPIIGYCTSTGVYVEHTATTKSLCARARDIAL